MIRQSASIFWKNIKLLVRSRSSALIVILGPLLLMLLVGFAFNSMGTQDVDIGIYSEKYTTLTLSYVKTLADGPFHTLKYVSEEACVDHIKKGLVATCVIFPPEMTATDTKIDEIVFYVDYSRVNIVYQVLERVFKEVGKTSRDISFNLTEDLLTTLTIIQMDINETLPLVQEISDTQARTRSILQTTSDHLGSTNVRYNRENLDVEEASLGLGIAQNKMGEIYSQGLENTEQCGDTLQVALREAQGCAGSDEEEEELAQEINASEIYARQSLIDASYAQAQKEVNKTRDLLITLNKQLDMLDNDLGKLNDAKTAARRNISASQNILKTANQQTENVQKSLREINGKVDSLALRNALNIVAPINTKVTPIIPETTNISYLFPTLLVMLLMFSAILLSSMLVVTEKKSMAYFRNFITPAPGIAYICGTLLSTLLIVLLQMSILLLVSDMYFHTRVWENIQAIAPLLIAMALVFSIIGLFIGYLFNSEDTVTLGAISISSIMLFVSDAIMPLESMPSYISQIAQFNPFVLASQSFKKILLFSTPLESLTGYLFYFALYCVVLFVSLVLLERMLKKRSIDKMTNQYAIKKEKKKWRQLIELADLDESVEAAQEKKGEQ